MARNAPYLLLGGFTVAVMLPVLVGIFTDLRALIAGMAIGAAVYFRSANAVDLEFSWNFLKRM
jgi:hypothetical protein